MASFRCYKIPHGSATLSNSAEPAPEQALVAGSPSTLKQEFFAGPTLAFEPVFAPGSTPVNLVFVLLSASDIGVGPVSESLSPAIAPGLQLVEITGPVIYSKTKLQKLLRIYIGTKRSFNNELRSILKACYLNLNSEKSHLNCYRF